MRGGPAQTFGKNIFPKTNVLSCQVCYNIRMDNQPHERNRTMKRLIAAILALALALTLTACNGKKKSASDSDLAARPATVETARA